MLKSCSNRLFLEYSYNNEIRKSLPVKCKLVIRENKRCFIILTGTN